MKAQTLYVTSWGVLQSTTTGEGEKKRGMLGKKTQR